MATTLQVWGAIFKDCGIFSTLAIYVVPEKYGVIVPIGEKLQA